MSLNRCIPFCCNICHFAADYALKPPYFNTCADSKGGGNFRKGGEVPPLLPPCMNPCTLSEEKERLAEQNRELLAANDGLEERSSSLQHQLSEAENLRKDKAAMFQEIEDLQNKLTAEV